MPTPLQTASATGSTTTSIAKAFTSNMSSGSTMVAIVTSQSSTGFPTVSAVKDTAGNSFVDCSSVANSGDGNFYIWALNTPAGDVGGTTTITATIASGAATEANAILIQEWPSGTIATSTTAAGFVDGTATTVNTSGNGGWSPAYTSAASGELLLTAMTFHTSQTYTSSPTGYTRDSNSISGSAAMTMAAYKSSTGGAETTAWPSWGTATNYSGIIFAFKPGSAAPASMPPPPPRLMVPKFRASFY